MPIRVGYAVSMLKVFCTVFNIFPKSSSRCHNMLRYPFFCPLLTTQVTPAMMVEAPCTTVEITRGSLTEWVWSTITPARGGLQQGHSSIIRDISTQL